VSPQPAYFVVLLLAGSMFANMLYRPDMPNFLRIMFWYEATTAHESNHKAQAWCIIHTNLSSV
jgi:hypothetical protein